MIIEQIYTGCLAHAAYYIESNGEAAIIDPLRDIEPYIHRAEKSGAKIKYVLETHFHADFVSGHLDLAKRTGAQIVYGPGAQASFDVRVAADGEELPLGSLKIRVLHTPGHTMESSSFLLLDENGKEYAVFTGDTLFLGDVGRPDLAQKGDITKEVLAGMLYDSLHTKIMTLPDETLVYPGHGAGSACGKNISSGTHDTIGHQKQINYALKAETREQFIKEVTDGLQPPPYYFPQNARINKGGYRDFDELVAISAAPLSPHMFELMAEAEEALILDTRQPNDFVNGFIPGSISIGLGGDFAPWAGTMITDIDQPLLLVCDEGKELEAITRLARVGYDHVIGYLNGGFESWLRDGKPADTIRCITAEELKPFVGDDSVGIVDVRREGEYLPSHVKGAVNAPLAYINDHMSAFGQHDTDFVYCAGGYRSVIACSVLKARGFNNVINVLGGFSAIKETDLPLESAASHLLTS